MTPPAQPHLQRALGLPLLVFYGLGVTVGAGIFALIGEILGMAGDFAPLAFLIAGLVAAATARSYALLAPRFPKAGGAAVYATEGIGRMAGRLVGLGVATIGVISSAVIALAFAGYVGTLVGLPEWLLAPACIALLAGVACLGVRESVAFAAAITILETGALVLVAAVGIPALADGEVLARLLTLPGERAQLDILVAAAAVAFFAFIGFEDIVNMAEEAKAPERTMGPAIAITLTLSTSLYVLIAAIAAAVPDRAAISQSDAPLADLFSMLTGWPAAPISTVAAVAMVNGILVQILMVSRVLYGMANDGLLPEWIGAVSKSRRTPVRATLFTAAAIAVLATVAPMVGLAQATGYITLIIFTAVNVSLFRLASRPDWRGARHLRWWGVVGAALSIGLLAYDGVRMISGS